MSSGGLLRPEVGVIGPLTDRFSNFNDLINWQFIKCLLEPTWPDHGDLGNLIRDSQPKMLIQTAH